jgi:SpoVK/Ycf46/Vps4 family AAA+-type ATPase
MTEKNRVYHKFQNSDNKFYPMKNLPLVNHLPSGVYEFNYDWENEIGNFKRIDTNYDQLVNLPSKEFDSVVNEIGLFLNEETKKSYDKYGFLYKRSMLLYGEPGTGKTCIVNKVSELVRENGGIVLFNPDPAFLPKAYEYLNDIQPNALTMVVFEELDQWLNNREEELLHLLDGEIQKTNVIYLSTTNFIDEIPKRICRPGRFSKLIEVGFPNSEARKVYLDAKLDSSDKNKFNVEKWVKKSEGLSIDELKETVLSVCCLNQELDTVIKRIMETKELQTKMIESKSRAQKNKSRDVAFF